MTPRAATMITPNDPTSIAAHRAGSGAPVVVLHPAGFGSPICELLVDHLRDHVEVIVPDRRGYGASAALAPPSSIDDASDDLARLLDELDLPRVTVVGVSAGATLTLAFMVRHPDRVGAALSHEPLLGPIAPQLHEVVTARIAALEEEPDAAVGHAVPVFMSELVGTRTWNGLRASWREDVQRNSAATLHEVGLFPTFAVDGDQLADLAEHGLISSIGAHSGPARREVAEVLATHGVPVRVIDGVGHLPLAEDPAAFARLVLATLAGQEPM